jgi:hypothetical protein
MTRDDDISELGDGSGRDWGTGGLGDWETGGLGERLKMSLVPHLSVSSSPHLRSSYSNFSALKIKSGSTAARRRLLPLVSRRLTAA